METVQQDRQKPELPPGEFQRLMEAFQVFNQASATLQRSYQDLQAETHRLSVELASVNADLERSLAERERVQGYLESILKSLNNGVIVVSKDRTVRVCNPAAAQLLGLPADLREGTIGFGDLPLPALLTESIEKALTHEDCAADLEVDAEGGQETRSLAVSFSLLTEVKDRCSGVIVILRDITRLKDLERQTQRAQRLQAMGEMAVQLAHEIRNPLGSIELFASLLSSELEGTSSLRSWSDQISAGVKFLNTIVSNMLAFTRTQKGGQFRTVDLCDLTLSTLEFCRPVFEQRQIQVETSFDADIHVTGDADLLRQMLMNLFMNALQAMPERGRLFVRVSAHPDEAQLEIEDTGIGIPDEHLPRVFDPFFTTSERGTGLGLALVHQIVEKHQGKVTVESEFGEGTLFTVSLPRAFENVLTGQD
ncbi:MAG: ATP-binding protein [Acidobacteriota bacterium]